MADVSGGALALTPVPAGVTQATSAPIEVLNTHESGPGPVRAASDSADGEVTTPTDPAVITFASKLSGSIDLHSDLPHIQSVDIEGPGAGSSHATQRRSHT